eukprot:CCRYP_010596-RB/>CCRYP_010596-RB protein AED:0.30 eAED:0.30 QI:346/1/0.85/1/0.66/0.42/7/3303/563
MDFLTLANTAHETSRSLLRILTETSGNEDDDFAHLENAGHGGGAATHMESGTGTFSPNGTGTESRPLLSPTAEAALLELSTNFLLYAAMVIITTMVAKIYFPSWLEPREERITPLSHSYMNVMDHAYKSDLSDDDDEDGDGEEEGEKETEGLLLDTEQGGETEEKQWKTKDKGAILRSGTSSFLTDYDSGLHTKESVYSNLVICAIMLNLTFVVWGLLQERMLTRRYPRHSGEYFTYSYALVFTNRFWTLVMSGLLLLYFKPRTSRTTIIYEYSFPSISNMLSSWCQYEALRYVSFPAVTLFKAFKLAPVMLMGKLLGNQSCKLITSAFPDVPDTSFSNDFYSSSDPQYDYIVAIFVGVGIAMFMTSTDELTFDFDVYGEQSSAKWTGVMLLLFFLFFDSFTSQWQSRMFKIHRDLSMIELMFATSAFSTVLSLITLVHDGKLWPAFDFVVRHSEIQFHFFVFSVCSTIGQLFIFYTIKNFGALVFAIIMTTRILISIALSVILYEHKVTSTGFFGLSLVVGAVFYRIKRKAEGRQLIKWQGMGEKSEKEIELVQEWHEHLDT